MEKREYSAYCNSLIRYERRATRAVQIGELRLGGDAPIRVQSMTNTDTNDTGACVAQTSRIASAGGELVRLTAQGVREAQNLGAIAKQLRARGVEVPLVADIHFQPKAALEALLHVEKVRINPGNFPNENGELEALVSLARERGVVLRIGVNHGSLGEAIVERYGDTPEGMAASAIHFIELCRALDFHEIVLSLKSSNVRVMVHAYRLLALRMRELGWEYPLHLGVTEAGNDLQGRIKSAVGIGALLSDGLGDTIRVSLTEAPEREIPVAKRLIEHLCSAEQTLPTAQATELTPEQLQHYSPYRYQRRVSASVEGVGAETTPRLYEELSAEARERLIELEATHLEAVATLPEGAIVLLRASASAGVSAGAGRVYPLMRAFFLQMEALGKHNPVVVAQRYDSADAADVALCAAADLGTLFLDGFGDGIRLECPHLSEELTRELSLAILQAARVRTTTAEYISCPGCGRTLYDLEHTLSQIKARTSHLCGVKIGVMGCIVNGPGEMADADYGYVGSGRDRITLYKGQQVVKRNIPQSEAIEELIALIDQHGQWREP